MSHLLPADWLEQEPEDIAQLAPVQWLDWPLIAETGVVVGIKREDLLHPQLGGNKLYKLHGHLRVVRADKHNKHNSVLSFGGAWSNHIYALAAAGESLGLSTLGVIRGEKPRIPSATLADAQAMGMQLHFVSRADYQRKRSPAFLAELARHLGPFYAIPEGGGDLLGARGAMALGRGLSRLRLSQAFDIVCSAVGTGSTLAGLAAGLPRSVKLYGFSVLKGEGTLADDVSQLIQQLAGDGANWQLESGYHCGGYARYPDELADFVAIFESQTGIPLDPVYTAKMMLGIAQKALAGHWSAGTKVIALHTGGLQGRRGYSNKFDDGTLSSDYSTRKDDVHADKATS